MQSLSREEAILMQMYELYNEMKDAKPADRSNRDRRFAVTITEFEKVIAYYKTWVVDRLDDPK